MSRKTLVPLLAVGIAAQLTAAPNRGEIIPPGERTLIEAMAEGARRGTELTRDAHAQGHGCVSDLTFTVNSDATWPRGLRREGIFAEGGKVFQAVARFSNGAGEADVDNRKGGAHGLAIKVKLDRALQARLRPLPGEIRFPQVAEDLYTTQDFLGINRVSVFFVKDVPDYIVFSQAKGGAGALAKRLIGEKRHHPKLIEAASGLFFRKRFLENKTMDESSAAVAELLTAVAAAAATSPAEVEATIRTTVTSLEGRIVRGREAVALGRLASIRMIDPLAEVYHSMVPSLYGEQTVKYRMRPCVEVANPDRVPVPPGVDIVNDKYYPKAVLKKHLVAERACYKLDVLVHREGMPSIEDGVADWGNDGYVNVAEIRFPQRTEGRELMDEKLCERMAFTPWHTLPEHLPVGGIQRARERIYVEVANQRNRNLDAKEAKERQP